MICKGSWLEKWLAFPIGLNKCGAEMVPLRRDEWPDKVFKTPLVREVWRCPVCHRLEVFGDYPGP